MPKPDSVHAQGELPLPIALGYFYVWIEGKSGSKVASIGSRGSCYDQSMGIRVDCIDFPAGFLVPYSSLNVSIHMDEHGGCENNISSIARKKEQSIVHGNERSIINPSCGAAEMAQSRKVKSDCWQLR